MENFYYQKSAKDRAKESKLMTLLLGCFFILMSTYLIYASDSLTSKIFGWALLFISTIVSIILGIWSSRLSKTDEGWLIEATKESILWQAPKGINEQSFQLPLAEIEKIVCQKSSDIDFQDSYSLIIKSQEAIDLKPTHSGLNINQLIQYLVNQGILLETKPA